MDEPAAEENLKKFKRRVRKTPVLPIAAAFDQGIEKFKADHPRRRRFVKRET